ncbi:MAG: TIGR03013 family PEP-CTERM/XrtA system glycosyltransferase [Candidatus Thiodiazotropha sp. (ex Myrtea spinifera)]|nr:TIGR03013 family PEP-CTERM/XrtA system glycosyltransferase [Candidatus Thiodiazotropha sp. (ex Myrtea spinifera)]MCU7829400.1 TIGR03013 family PEP-CTERM/XrtA system glycosyltransferase [Candidatus Thiodiazotropha sp. (ex Myrtea sp. 'scaly one' KF741663)]
MIKLFGYFISKSFLLLALFETLCFVLSIWFADFYQRNFSETSEAPLGSEVSHLATIYAAVMLASMIALGLYQRGVLERASGFLIRLLLSFLVGGLLMSLVFAIFDSLTLPLTEFVLAMLFSMAGVLILRSAFVRLTKADSRKRRVLVLGTGINADRIELVQSDDPTLGFIVVGFIDLGDAVCLIDDNRQIPKDQHLFNIVERMAVDEIVIAVDDRRRGLPVNELIDCKMKGVEILDLLSFYEKEENVIKIDQLHPSWIFFSSGFYNGLMLIYFKRAVDILVSLSMLILFSPVILMVAMASLISTVGRDPVFYRQVRVGRNGKLFTIYKFRSMRVNAESGTGPRWADVNDSRVTRLGNFLRKTRLDELPQLMNVLKGEMSLVGPRPERPEFVRALSQQLPYYNERHRLKPGITGWAQLMHHYAADETDNRKKLEYDLYYIKNSGPFLDLIILIETVEVVLLAKGAR